MRCSFVKNKTTNLQNESLISADRGTKATLTLTIPRSIFKSYTKDLFVPIFELASASPGQTFVSSREPLQCYDLGPEPMLIHVTSGTATYRRFPAWILA